MDEIWLLLDSRGMGGIESHVAELAAGLREPGLPGGGLHPRVVFLADHGPHPLHDRLAAMGLPWTALPGGFAALRRAIAAGRPRLLHTHGYKANLLGRAAARLAGVPVVATYHAGDRPPGWLALYDALDRWSSCLGGRLAVSRPILARLPWAGVLAPNFVALPAAPVLAQSDTVAFVGRLAVEKGPDLFCRLAGAVPEIRFEAFGDGPLRVGCEATAAGRVRFHGAVAGMGAAWAGIGLLAVTSRAEGLPLAALEAMAHGVPVIAFGIGGLPDLVTDGRDGFLVPPGDLDGFAKALRRWHALPPTGRAGMAAAARETVATRFGRAAGISRVRAAYAAASR